MQQPTRTTRHECCLHVSKQKQKAVFLIDECRPPSKLLNLAQCHYTGTNLIFYFGFPVIFFMFLIFSQLQGKRVSLCPYLISLTLCVFYLKSIFLRAMLESLLWHVILEYVGSWLSGTCGIQGGHRSPGWSFPGMNFTSCTNTCLKYAVWAMSRHPRCSFPTNSAAGSSGHF